MLIGNRWVKKTRLKILNGFLAVTPAWATYAGQINTNLSERAYLVGFHQLYSSAAGTMLQLQILFDGQPAHQGFFRAGIEPADRYQANIQPTSMRMPCLDVPPNTEVTVRGNIAFGANHNSYVDLYAVVYYLKDWEDALPAVCFPSDVVAPGQV